MPTGRLKRSNQIKAQSSAVTASMMSPSLASARGLVRMGRIIAATPSTSRILAMFDPTTLPTAMPTAF